MIEGVRARSEVTASISVPLRTPDAAGGFAALLNSLAASPVSTNNMEILDRRPANTPAASGLPGRASLTQALHYLVIRARPRAPVTLLSSQKLIAAAAREARSTLLLASSQTVSSTSDSKAGRPLALRDYPRPPADNGRGIHWIPTTRQPQEVVDRFVGRLQDLGMRWVTFLNEAGDLTGNEYLVRRLVSNGAMPIMRIYTESGAAIQEDVTALVQRYRQLGVPYFQLFNEPNLRVENEGKAPDVNRYLDLWLPAARQVLAAGGLPGFGALSPQGDAGDLDFLRQALEGLKARGAEDVLNRTWISVHNYGRDHLRVREYDKIVREVTGRSLPLIGTEAGLYAEGGVGEEEQVRTVTEAYRYLSQREPYYFAYSYWVLANQAGGGHDTRWEYQALYRADGPTSLAQALEQLA
ncbi:MAG: hypothetical protein IT330_07220 [Anaerolineae bacterium]|nr:hypothetical protein [Anaerolineae bacterium]